MVKNMEKLKDLLAEGADILEKRRELIARDSGLIMEWDFLKKRDAALQKKLVKYYGSKG